MSDRRRRAGDPRATAKVYRNRRHANAIQIRKQRKEERLSRRRQRETPVANLPSHEDLMESLDALLLGNQSVEKLVQLQRRMKESTTVGTSIFLEKLLEHHEDKARSLVATLWRHIQHYAGNLDETKVHLATSFEASLCILLDLSSSLASKKTAADEYYGSAPIRWSDLLLDESFSVPLVQLLLQQLIRADSIKSITETTSNILGNLVQDAPSRALTGLLPSWSLFVRTLPVTAYLCACIVRQDGTHYSRDFLQDLTPQIIAQLLSQAETAADAAWILESLSRREPEAADMLCQNQALMETLLQLLEHSTAEVLVPTLQALDHLVDRHAGMFLSMPRFENIWAKLLQPTSQRPTVVLQHALYVTGNLLMDAGLPNHPATTVAARTFLPILVKRCVSTETASTVDVNRDTLWSIEMALAVPSIYQTGITSANGATEQMSMTIRSCHQDMIRTCLWESLSPETRQAFLQLLVDFIANPHDADGATAAIRILDRLLRTIPSSQMVFEQCRGGVDALEQVCLREDGPEEVASLAADLLDDFFEDQEDENAPNVAEESDHFVFGRPQPSRVTAFNLPSATSPTPAMGRGRGRGMTMPAWMKK